MYFNIFLNRLRDIVCINPTLSFNLNFNEKDYKIGNIISSFKEFLSYKASDSIDGDKSFYYEHIFNNIKLEVVLALLKAGKKDIVYSFVNNIATLGGTHINALRLNFLRFFNQKAIENKLLN